MSKSPNTVVVGAFVAGAFLILFIILFTLSGDLFRRNVDTALLVFDGSLKGLNVGAPVAFKGVQIGEVSSFSVFLDTDTLDVLTPVVVRVNRDAIQRAGSEKDRDGDLTPLIERGLRGQLQLQSLLTGLLYVQLDFYPGSEPRYPAEALSKYDIPDDYIVIPTIPKELERLTEGLQKIDFVALAEDAQKTLAGIDNFINDPDFQAIPKNLDATLAAVRELSERLDAEITALSPQLNELVAESGGAMKTLNAEMPALTSGAREALADLSETLETAKQALESLDYTLSDDSAVLYDVRKAAEEIGAAGRALQSLAESLETHPESLIKGKPAQ